jgi:hypothetical protein
VKYVLVRIVRSILTEERKKEERKKKERKKEGNTVSCVALSEDY